MPRHETPAQRGTIHRVMHEFKEGELPRGKGGKVRSRKQAIAIALSEAGASNRQSPAENRRRLRDTKRKERAGKAAQARSGGGRRSKVRNGKTRKELYAEARRQGLAGRSRMNKAQLERALHH